MTAAPMSKTLIVLSQDPACRRELVLLSRSAGYQVVEAGECDCCLRAPAPDAIVLQVDTGGNSGGDGVPARLPVPACLLGVARPPAAEWRLNLRHRRLAAPGGDSVGLTGLEFSFVRLLALVERGEAVSRRRIVQEFGEDYLTYEQNRIDTLVRRLRHKVARLQGLRLPLNTERLRGYSFGAVLIIDP
jgi:DNA-binding response OmpR family regulator